MRPARLAGLAPDEIALLERYRSSDEEARETIYDFAGEMAALWPRIVLRAAMPSNVVPLRRNAP